MASKDGVQIARAQEWLRKRGGILAGIIGIGVVGVVIGRATVSSTPPAPPPKVYASAAAPTGSAEAPHFDLVDDGMGHAGVKLRPMDRDIFAAVTDFSFTREQMLDLFPDRPYRVRLVGSYAEHRVGFVLIELQRNGTIDERWDIRQGDVKRIVPKDPNANGDQVQYTLRRGRWQVH